MNSKYEIAKEKDIRELFDLQLRAFQSERDVPISKALRPILERALEEMKENPMGLVFYDHNKEGIVETK